MTKEEAHTANSTFAKWRVEEVLVRSVFNITFVASRQVEVPNPPIRKSSNRYSQFYPTNLYLVLAWGLA
jgi:hypothetical protein